MIYDVERAEVSRDPLVAGCSKAPSTHRNFDRAQSAVDDARAFVRDYQGDALPQVRVYRRRRGNSEIILLTFRTPGGEIREERCDGKGDA